MLRFKCIAVAAALAAASAGSARADVLFELQIDGYSDLFKECEFGFAYTDFDAGFSRIALDYEVHVRGGKITDCTATFEDGYIDSQCRGVAGVDDDHTCEELTKVRPVGIGCYDGGGASVKCGTVKIRGPEIFTFD